MNARLIKKGTAKPFAHTVVENSPTAIIPHSVEVTAQEATVILMTWRSMTESEARKTLRQTRSRARVGYLPPLCVARQCLVRPTAYTGQSWRVEGEAYMVSLILSSISRTQVLKVPDREF